MSDVPESPYFKYTNQGLLLMEGIMSWYETLQVNSEDQEYLGIVHEATLFVMACLVNKACLY